MRIILLLLISTLSYAQTVYTQHDTFPTQYGASYYVYSYRVFVKEPFPLYDVIKCGARLPYQLCDRDPNTRIEIWKWEYSSKSISFSGAYATLEYIEPDRYFSVMYMYCGSSPGGIYAYGTYWFKAKRMLTSARMKKLVIKNFHKELGEITDLRRLTVHITEYKDKEDWNTANRGN